MMPPVNVQPGPRAASRTTINIANANRPNLSAAAHQVAIKGSGVNAGDQLDHRPIAINPPGANLGHRLAVAIDGPAAAGKTTVARALADRLGAIFLDTGLLYRAVTLAALRAGIASSDGEGLTRLTIGLDLRITPPSQPGRQYDVTLAGEDVTAQLRLPAVDAAVSAVSAHPGVRLALLPIQHEMAASGPVVMVGRDITTVVIPDAGVKVYLDASLAERARRRSRELQQRGTPLPLDQVESELHRRDIADASREASPLQTAPDAIVIQTDDRTVDQIVDELEAIVRAAWSRQRATVRE